LNAAPVIPAGAALACLLLPILATARSDGPEWEAADNPEGCRSCHLTTEPLADTGSGANGDEAAGRELAGVAVDSALSINDLPAAAEPGKTYTLTIRLEDPALRNAGFLLNVTADGKAAGELATTDARAETNGTRARSTWDGQWPEAPGLASWKLDWTAPDPVPAGLRFDLWGNAGNDDLSPLGDRIHHLTLALPAD